MNSGQSQNDSAIPIYVRRFSKERVMERRVFLSRPFSRAVVGRSCDIKGYELGGASKNIMEIEEDMTTRREIIRMMWLKLSYQTGMKFWRFFFFLFFFSIDIF